MFSTSVTMENIIHMCTGTHTLKKFPRVHFWSSQWDLLEENQAASLSLCSGLKIEATETHTDTLCLQLRNRRSKKHLSSRAQTLSPFSLFFPLFFFPSLSARRTLKTKRDSKKKEVRDLWARKREKCENESEHPWESDTPSLHHCSATCVCLGHSHMSVWCSSEYRCVRLGSKVCIYWNVCGR